MNPQDMTPEQKKELEEKLKNMSPEQIMQLQKQQCIFCQIITGKIPSKKVYEDEQCVAILDINPAAKGHLLLLPKEHYAIFPQLPNEVLTHLFKVAKKLSQVLLRALGIKGTTIFVANGQAAGQRAQHVMIHVIPRKEGDGLFQLEEKVISKELVASTKTALQPKVNELLNITQETQTTLQEEHKDEPKEAVHLDFDDEDDEQEASSQEESDSSEDETEESEDDTEEVEEDEDQDNKEDITQKKEDGVSLDDIANLFK